MYRQQVRRSRAEADRLRRASQSHEDSRRDNPDIRMGDEEIKVASPRDDGSDSSEEVPLTQWARDTRSSDNGRGNTDADSVSSEEVPLTVWTGNAGAGSRAPQQPEQKRSSASAAQSASAAPPARSARASRSNGLKAAQLLANRKKAQEEREKELYGRTATTIVQVENLLSKFSHHEAPHTENLRKKWIFSVNNMLSKSRDAEQWRVQYGYIFDNVYREVEADNRHLLLATDWEAPSPLLSLTPPPLEDEDGDVKMGMDAVEDPSPRESHNRSQSLAAPRLQYAQIFADLFQQAQDEYERTRESKTRGARGAITAVKKEEDKEEDWTMPVVKKEEAEDKEDVEMSTENERSSRKRKGRTISTVSINQRSKLTITPMADGPMTLMLQADLCTLSMDEFRRKYSMLDLDRWATYSAFGDDGPLPFDPDYTKKVRMLVGHQQGNTAYRPTDADIVHAVAMCDVKAFRAYMAAKKTRATFTFRTLPVWKLFYSANHLPISKFSHSTKHRIGLVEILEEIWMRSDELQHADVREFERRVAIEEAKEASQRVSITLNFTALLDDYAILLAYFCRADACLLVMNHLWNQLSQRQQILFLIYGPLYAGYNRKLAIKAKDRGILTYDIREWGRWFKSKLTQPNESVTLEDSDHYLFLSMIMPTEVIVDPTIWLGREVIAPILQYVSGNRGMGRKTATFKRFAGLKITGRVPTLKPKPYIKADFWTTLSASSEDRAIAECLRQISRGTIPNNSSSSSSSSSSPSGNSISYNSISYGTSAYKKGKLQVQHKLPDVILEKEVFQNPLFGTLYFDPRTVDTRVRDQLLDYPGTVPINPATITEYWQHKFQTLMTRVYVGLDRRMSTPNPIIRNTTYTIPAPVGAQYWRDTMRSSFSSLLYMLENPDGTPEPRNSATKPEDGAEEEEEEDSGLREMGAEALWERVGDELVVPKIFLYYSEYQHRLRSTIQPLPATIRNDIVDIDDAREARLVEEKNMEHVALQSRGAEYYSQQAAQQEEAAKRAAMEWLKSQTANEELSTTALNNEKKRKETEKRYPLNSLNSDED